MSQRRQDFLDFLEELREGNPGFERRRDIILELKKLAYNIFRDDKLSGRVEDLEGANNHVAKKIIEKIIKSHFTSI